MNWSRSSMRVRIVIPVLLVLAVAFGWSTAMLAFESRDNTVQTSVAAGADTIAQFKAVRAYYTSNVVNKVKAASDMKVSFDHKNNKDTIPIPATFMHDMGDMLAQQKDGVQFKLYSPYPFANRRDRVLDPFAKEAIAYLFDKPGEVFSRAEVIDGKEFVRVAVVDRLSAQGCVDCHNTDPNSPKKDWKLNDVRGVMEVDSPISKVLATNRTLLWINGGITGLMALCAAGLLMWVLGRSVESPLKGVIDGLSTASNEVQTASGQLVQTSQQLSQGASEQAGSLQQTTATLGTISGMVK
ncbi:MAG TPA: DUF3365 domain-containing protein, partial [bacterium]